MINDLYYVIACSAVENGLKMVTENVSEFERVTGIVIENWVVRP